MSSSSESSGEGTAYNLKKTIINLGNNMFTSRTAHEVASKDIQSPAGRAAAGVVVSEDNDHVAEKRREEEEEEEELVGGSEDECNPNSLAVGRRKAAMGLEKETLTSRSGRRSYSQDEISR